MIKVIHPGFHTSIQDLGRFHYRSIGVPVSGAMDQNATQLANALLNNCPNAAVLEIVFGRCQLLFQEDTLISITGANFSATLEDTLVPVNTAIFVQKGSTLKFGKRIYGSRTYIGVSGGFQTEEKLGSKSFFSGITEATLLYKEMLLPVKKTQQKPQDINARVKVCSSYFTTRKIACFKGPEFALLDPVQIEKITTTEFCITPENNRMGYTLAQNIPNNFSSMLTSAVQPGTVQLTPSGKLIILMRDSQVTGGYPRILQLSPSAINILAQKTTNDYVQFRLIQNLSYN